MQTGDFDIEDDLTIKSAGSGFPTISGNGLDRVFDVSEQFESHARSLGGYRRHRPRQWRRHRGVQAATR